MIFELNQKKKMMKSTMEKVERMASQTNSNVYLETVEEAGNKSTESDKTWNGAVKGIPKR